MPSSSGSERFNQFSHILLKNWLVAKLSDISKSDAMLKTIIGIIIQGQKNHVLFELFKLQVDVLESQFSQLLQQINSTRDFESIRLAHDHFLSNLLAQSFILLKPVWDAKQKWCSAATFHPPYLRPLCSPTLTFRCFTASTRSSSCAITSALWSVRLWFHWTTGEPLSSIC